MKYLLRNGPAPLVDSPDGEREVTFEEYWKAEMTANGRASRNGEGHINANRFTSQKCSGRVVND